MLRLVQPRENAVDPGDAFQAAAINASHRGEWQEARRLWLLAAEHTADNYRAGVRRANAERLVLTGRAKAFTLMEVLIAIAIFAIGAIAVASIFPAAIYLQRETVRDVQANHTAISAEAAIVGKRFRVPAADWAQIPPDWTDEPNTANNIPTVSPLPASALEDWPVQDRSSVATDPGTATRESYWVPLVYRSPGPPMPQSRQRTEFRMIYYFVLSRKENTDYFNKAVALGGGNEWAVDDPQSVPGVRSIGVTVGGARRFSFTNVDNPTLGFDHWVEAGDKILDRFGNIYTVVGADNLGIDVDGNIMAALAYDDPMTVAVETPTPNDRIWFAPRGAARHIGVMMDTPSRRIIVEE